MTENNTARRKDWPMSYVRACMAFGNGDVGRGKHAIFMLARRLEEAREKHPIFAESAEEAVEVIGEEWAELSHIRFAIGEHETHGGEKAR